MNCSTLSKVFSFLKNNSLIIFLGGSLLCGSCKKSTPLPASGFVGSWSVVAIADTVSSSAFPSAYPIAMTVTPDSIYIHTGANGYSYTYSTSSNNGFSIKSILRTAVASTYSQWETRFINLLEGTKSYQPSTTMLYFYEGNKNYKIQFIKK